jgi:hypothetical protein
VDAIRRFPHPARLALEPGKIRHRIRLYAGAHRSADRCGYRFAEPRSGRRRARHRCFARASLPAVTVLWWSARTVRLAEEKHLESRIGAAAKGKIGTAALPDYVLAVAGDEPLRILRDAREDLRDTVFLELENGGTLDFTTVEFVDDTDAETLRTEFHFPRSLDGHPAIDPESRRVVFHCRAIAKKEIPGRNNSLSFRVEFSPRTMKARGQPDL